MLAHKTVVSHRGKPGVVDCSHGQEGRGEVEGEEKGGMGEPTHGATNIGNQ